MLSFTGKGLVFSNVLHVLSNLFGVASILIPFLLFSAGLMLIGAKWSFTKPHVFLGAMIVFFGCLGLFGLGSMGFALREGLSGKILPAGASLLFAIATVAGFLLLIDMSLGEVLHAFADIFEIIPGNNEAKKDVKMKKTDEVKEDTASGFKINLTPKEKEEPAETSKEIAKPVGKLLDAEKKIELLHTTPAQAVKNTVSNIPAQIWTLPPLSLLDPKSGGQADRGNVKENAQIIENTLDSFGINARVVEVNPGPAVTQYAIAIGSGTKLSKITALANDLALALAAPTGQIRIEAPIPGKSLVGIEIPNRSPEYVTLRRMLSSEKIQKATSKLSVALGLNVAGEPVMVDIGKMPHALIAGATGSGKSVAINAFIASLLFRATPDEVKFIMVDPKRVELTQYNDIPHLLTPVITEPQKVLAALRWAAAEMDSRYKLFAEVGVRNISAYNEMAGFQSMYYIVIVIDELADIMLFAPAEVEETITRIAQMARAVGIHLILATQRPSVNVITGLIKANIPTRIAFNVSSMIDSRVILDTPGAEKLIGRGDMLYVPPDQAKPSRVQGTYVSDQEIHRLITFIKEQGQKPAYSQEITEKYQPVKGGTGGTEGAGTSGKDSELLVDAIKVILQYNRASVSILQRRLSLGYGRAARIMDQLSEEGIVGEADGSKNREIFVSRAQEFIAAHEAGGQQ